MFFRLVCFALLPALIIGDELQQNEGSPVSPRIVGGVPVDIRDFPYQVSYIVMGSLCGGAIISESFVISAGHCVRKFDDGNITIRVNSTSLLEGGSLYQVKHLHLHPKYEYEFGRSDYDLVVLELDKPLTFGDGVQPIRLPESDEQLPNRTVLTISGWGAISEDNSMKKIPSRALQTVNVFSYASEESMIAIGDHIGAVTDRMIGGHVPGGGQNSCKGDSGGPVTHDGVVYGLVSWTRGGCASSTYPTIYTRIAHPSLRAFIKEVTGI